MRPPVSTQHLRRLLESDRNWCAYALADLYPPYAKSSQWLIKEGAVVLIYGGFQPPILFAHGDPHQALQLLSAIGPGKYQYGLMGAHRDLLAYRMCIERETRMWRMVLDREFFPDDPPPDEVVSLGLKDLPRMLSLFNDHPDAPDTFHESQLAQGPFFGILSGDRLVCVSGVHVVSPQAGVAAVGNIFTHPSHRGRGHARRASAAVVHALLDQGIQTIVLNVAMDNQAAIGCYRGLGFWPFCGYYEGVADLAPANT